MTGRLKSLEWKNNVLYLLDQRKLPQKQEYLACTDYKEADVYKRQDSGRLRAAEASFYPGCEEFVKINIQW